MFTTEGSLVMRYVEALWRLCKVRWFIIMLQVVECCIPIRHDINVLMTKLCGLLEVLSTFNISNKRLRLEWSKHNEICSRSIRRWEWLGNYSPKWLGSRKLAIPSLIWYSWPQFAQQSFPSITCVSISSLCRSLSIVSSTWSSLGLMFDISGNPSWSIHMQCQFRNFEARL